MTSELIKSAKLSPASLKLVKQATDARDALLALSSEIEPDRNGRQSNLHLIADEAVAAFWATPTRELAEKAHDALVRNRDAQVSFDVLNEGIHRNLPKVAKLAEPAALEIIDQAIAELNRQHEAAVAASPEGGVFSTRAQLDLQHVTALSDLQAERNAILAGADPLHWLEMHGHGA